MEEGTLRNVVLEASGVVRERAVTNNRTRKKMEEVELEAAIVEG